MIMRVKSIHIVVMNNITIKNDSEKILELYDLKGSDRILSKIES